MLIAAGALALVLVAAELLPVVLLALVVFATLLVAVLAVPEPVLVAVLFNPLLPLELAVVDPDAVVEAPVLVLDPLADVDLVELEAETVLVEIRVNFPE